nr:integrase, catalytic region, zinc finger, CCHC-type, peptidase aspartic, catalytic [Tanacetum cinerariifolium]
MAKIQEVPTADNDSEPLEQKDQNDVESDDERVALANLKLDVGENKNIQKQLKKANTTLAQELKECKTILAKTSKTLGESNSVRDKIVDNAWIKHSKDQFRALTAQDMEILIQTCLMHLALKTQHDSFIFVHELKQEMHADLKYVESLEKEIDELESDKAEFSNMYDMLLQECVSNDVTCSYLLSFSDLDALAELQCLYLHKVKECECLAQKPLKQTEYVSKEVHTELLQCFSKVEKYLISLEIDLQKYREQVKNDTFWNEPASNVFRKEREQCIKIQYLKAQLQDKNIAISKLAPFSNSLERRYFSKTKSIQKTNVSEGLSKPVTAQTLPRTARQAVSNTNVLKPGMYRIDNRTTQTRAPQSLQTVRNNNPHVSTSTRVNHKTNVSRPQHKNNQLKDKVLPNNSQVKPKKTQVEEHPKIPSVSNKTKSIVQLILFIVDSGCTKHMTGNLKLLCNFIEKFLGIVRFGNDQFTPILGYGDLVQDSRGSDLYTISLQESTSSTPLYLMLKPLQL